MTGRGLANAYAQTLGTIFTETTKPYEVEIVVAEVGDGPDDDQIYRLTYDGSVVDEHGYVAMGGQAEAISSRSRGGVRGRHVDSSDAVRLAVKVLGRPRGRGGPRPSARSCWRSPSWTAAGPPCASSAGSPTTAWASCSPTSRPAGPRAARPPGAG